MVGKYLGGFQRFSAPKANGAARQRSETDDTATLLGLFLQLAHAWIQVRGDLAVLVLFNPCACFAGGLGGKEQKGRIFWTDGQAEEGEF